MSIVHSMDFGRVCQNRFVRSPHESYLNVFRQYKVKCGPMKMPIFKHDNQIWGVKRPNHISGLLQIIKRVKRFICPPQGIVVSIC